MPGMYNSFQASTILTAAAKKELDNGAQILQEHPSLNVSIIGHTG